MLTPYVPLECLTDAQLLDAGHQVETLMTRLLELRESANAAKMKLLRTYPICSCGRPVKLYGYMSLSFVRCNPAIRIINGRAEAVMNLQDDWDSSDDLADIVLSKLTGDERWADSHLRVGMCELKECKGFVVYSTKEDGPLIDTLDQKTAVDQSELFTPSACLIAQAQFDEKSEAVLLS